MTLGVIGGLGPMATAYFMELVVKMTKADCDQEHLDMIIYSCPKIPDRTAYILGRSEENPVKDMSRVGKLLAQQGADCIAIPCITAHYFHQELSEKIPVPIIHGIYETGAEIKKYGIQKVGIMATDGTIQSRIFQKQIEEMGMEAILPDTKHQKYVMDIIYGNVKAGIPVDMDKFDAVSVWMKKQGAQVIILGCTELSIVKKEHELGPGFVDAMEVLAQRSVVRCRGRLKEEYEHLIKF